LIDDRAAGVDLRAGSSCRVVLDATIAREHIMTKRTIVATAVAIFAAGTFATAAHAAGVKCGGSNACKGQSACKGTANSCKGQNACKGQGFTEAGTSLECTQKGGKVL
jgi:hypothetical protein